MQQAFFDTYAQTYDDHFTNSMIGKAQRSHVQRYMVKLADRSKEVLEINGGTGEDALFLSNYFKQVTCTDISQAMLNVAEKKSAGKTNIKWKQSSIQQLKQNVTNAFDLVFSNFGGLNCLSPQEMVQFSKDMSSTKDLILVVMGRKCLWERIIFWWRRDEERCERRKRSEGVEAELNGNKFLVYYYSPKELANNFSGEFKIVRCLPIGLFIPPSYMEQGMQRRKGLFSILKALDSVVMNVSSLSDYADHYLIHLTRK